MVPVAPTLDVGLPEVPRGWREGVCVFCGSRNGKGGEYELVANQLGEALAKRGYPLIYGGIDAGLMGIVSSAAISSNPPGRVHGIRPSSIVALKAPVEKVLHWRPGTNQYERASNPKEWMKTSVLKQEDAEAALVIESHVSSVHKRKKKMAHWAQRGFVILPGGFGVLDELAEMTINWVKAHDYSKPLVVLNVRGFFSPIRDWINNAIEEGLMSEDAQKSLIFVDNPSTSAAKGNPSPHNDTSLSTGEAVSQWDWGVEALKALDAFWESRAEQLSKLEATNSSQSEKHSRENAGLLASLKRGKTGSFVKRFGGDKQ